MNLLEGAQIQSPITLGQRLDRDDRTALHTSPSNMAAGAFFAVYIFYQAFLYFNPSSLSTPKLVWNCFASVVPSTLLSSSNKSKADGSNTATGASGAPEASCEAPRTLLGSGQGGLLSSLQATMARAKRAAVGLITSRVSDGPPGLVNMSTSCYQNSVLQGLASLPAVREFLSNATCNEPTVKSPLIPTLSGLVNALNDPANHGQTFLAPPALQAMSSGQQDAQEYYSKLLSGIDDKLRKASRDASTDQARALLPGRADKEEVGYFGTVRPTRLPSAHAVGHDNPLQGLQAQRVGCLKCGFSEGLSMVPFNCITVPLGQRSFYDIADCLGELTAWERIDGVKCPKCSLLWKRRQLQTLHGSLVGVTDKKSSKRKHEEALERMVRERLEDVQATLDDEDFTDTTLKKRFNLPSDKQVETTKSKQVVIARAPTSLVIHFNRSNFDEFTGRQSKNTAMVFFPKTLDLSPWCLGSRSGRLGRSDAQPIVEEWEMNPGKNMLATDECRSQPPILYNLRAVVTHYGEHDNGHYTCYRKHPYPATSSSGIGSESDAYPNIKETWWCLSDAHVSMVSEAEVLQQDGAFMLFYERAATEKEPLAAIGKYVATSSDLTVTETPSAVDVGDEVAGGPPPLARAMIYEPDRAPPSPTQTPLAVVVGQETDEGHHERATAMISEPEAVPRSSFPDSCNSSMKSAAIAQMQRTALLATHSQDESCTNCITDPDAASEWYNLVRNLKTPLSSR